MVECFVFLRPLGLRLAELQRGFDRFFDEDWPRLPSTSLGRDWNPTAAIAEDDSAYHITVDLPGVTKDQIKIDLTDGCLTVSGERKEEKKDEKEKEYYSEVFYGSFLRTFQLPQAVDAEKVNAKYENGVLKVDLAKTAPSKAREIQIK